MHSYRIQLRTIEDVKDFVRIVNACPCDVDIASGRYVVDAKSIMALFSLDLGKPILVEVREDGFEDLEADLKRFSV